jgi:hypothetical protein
MKPSYDLDKIRYSVDPAVLKRALGLHNNGRIRRFREEAGGYEATVRGGSEYSVYVSARNFDQGNCDCYLGQNDVLCKHIVAVALYAVSEGKKIDEARMSASAAPMSSGQRGALNRDRILEIKGEVTAAMRCIKPYDGPSRIWFAYQASLSEGCARLADIVSGLPVCPASARLLVDMLLRLDRKLCMGGVDDSDGTVGDFMTAVVEVLLDFARIAPECVGEFRKLRGRDSSFGWEEPLVALLK